MRDELLAIQNQLENTSRLGFMFSKGKVVEQLSASLEPIETNLSQLENLFSQTEARLFQTQENLALTEQNLASTQADLSETQGKLAQTSGELSQKITELTATQADLTQTKSTLEQTQQNLADTQKNLAKTEKTLSGTQMKLADTEKTLSTTKTTLSNTTKTLSETKTKLDNTLGELTFTQKSLEKSDYQLKRTEEDLAQEMEKSQQLNSQLTNANLRSSIVSHLLNANFEHKGVTEFNRVLKEEFLPFANEESTLVNEAEMLLHLQNVEKELKIIGAYPEFHKKNTIAVAGGFSAGKSEFISSLFKNKKMKLPSGVLPTTAIPVYAMNGKQEALLGCSQMGGVVDLFKIDRSIQEKLSHNFLSEFGFNLKNIMPYMFLTTEMPYKHLCFIDTPGYNPAKNQESYSNEDFQTASDFVSNAHALLWLVGAGAGTMPKSDLEFLEKFAEDKDVYIIINKADLRAKSDLEDILDSVLEMVEDYDINCVGVSAFSSTQGKEIAFREQSLLDFLAEYNEPSDYHQSIIDEINLVHRCYHNSIQQYIDQANQKIERLEETRKQLAIDEKESKQIIKEYEKLLDYYKTKENINSAFVDAHNSMIGRFFGDNILSKTLHKDYDNFVEKIVKFKSNKFNFDKIEQDIMELKESLNTDKQTDQLYQLSVIIEKFKSAVDMVFGSISTR